MNKERIRELTVFLLTLNAEGWKPQRENWGDDITDLLALLEEAQIKAGAKPTVTREWIEKYFFEGGLVDTAVALLRAVGITVEEEKCLTCDGRGIVYSDPDGKQLICGDCQGKGK